MKKGNIFFNVIIVIATIGLISVGGYGIYYYISNLVAVKEAEDAVDEFERRVLVVAIDDEPVQNVIDEPEIGEEPEEDEEPVQTTTSSRRSSSSVSYYKGYDMIGTIQIPRISVKAPIVDKVTPSSIAASVGHLYGPGLNLPGNNVLVAHNYRNGTFFSNNKKLEVGDKIYVTDLEGEKVEYTITKTYITEDSDFSYATRNTDGSREISLSTCTTDPSKRLVIWAKEY